MEFDKLNKDVQNQILDILHTEASYPKEVAVGVVEDWFAEADDEWTAEEWIKEAKEASL